MTIAFFKMEALGNDYIFIDAVGGPHTVEQPGVLARRWSDRHFGIGGDGLIVMAPSACADVRMRMWNADGSEGAMCGNGLRSLAVLAFERGHAGIEQTIETPVGVRRARIRLQGDRAVGAEVEIGEVRIDPQPRSIRLAGLDQEITCWLGDAGNPHAVVLLDTDPESYPVAEVGAAMQDHPAFAGGVNVEFVCVRTDGGLQQRTFERGSGETMACGSGAATAALVAIEQALVPGPRVAVHLRGGVLEVWRDGLTLVIGGPARTVFRGEIDLPDV